MTPITINSRLKSTGRADTSVTLPFELRQRSRLLVTLDSGEEARLILDRGSVLRGGDLLQADDGRIIQVVAAPETLSVVRASDATALARAAYHLGNRHVALQIASESLRYLHDHVLDEMVRGLGMTVTVSQLPFEPESGAYSQESAHEHSHVHSHVHGHDHDHSHDHGHHGHADDKDSTSRQP